MSGFSYSKDLQPGRGSLGEQNEWLLILYSLLTWDEEKQGGDINIACNHKEMGKFDDIVFFLPNGDEIVIQAKHQGNPGENHTLLGLIGQNDTSGILREIFPIDTLLQNHRIKKLIFFTIKGIVQDDCFFLHPNV